jgi:hypothetical protein
MSLKSRCCLKALFFALQFTVGLDAASAAVNVLECRLLTGEAFVLRSEFKHRLIPALTPQNSAEYDRKPWNARFFDKKGEERSAGLDQYTVHAGASESRDL